MKLNSLTELRIVLAVARRRGVRAAAQELGMSSSAVSHAIAALEQRLDARLFNRTTRSIVLTEAGEAFVEEIAPALESLEAAAERIGAVNTRPLGTLRINTFLIGARMVLTPIILEYLRLYPDVQVELVTEGALIDVIGEGFDAGIRIAEAVPPDMIAVPIPFEMRMVVVATPSYLAANPAPLQPEDLTLHSCIRARMTTGRIYHWEFERDGVETSVEPTGPLVIDEAGLMEEATLAGLGLAFLPKALIAPRLESGELVQVLGEWTPAYPGLCLYYPSRRHVPAKLRAMIELIRSLR